MTVQAIQALEPEFGLPVLLKVAGMARSTYYYRLNALKAPDKYGEAREKLKELHERHKCRYGYRRMTAALRDCGFSINHKTVRKLMREEGIECKIRRKRKAFFKPSPELAASPNILKRDFSSDAPWLKAVTDVTELYIGAKKVYASALLDLYDGAIMSFVLSTSNDSNLVMSMYESMPKDEFKRLDNMLVHSDQGILYRSHRYHEFIASKKMVQSMSRRGNCYDNAVAESFFGTFKCETIKLYRIDTLEQLAKELEEYARYYNQERIKSTLGYKTPMEYRRLHGF